MGRRVLWFVGALLVQLVPAGGVLAAVGDNTACFGLRPYPVVDDVSITAVWGCAKTTGTVAIAINWGDSATQFTTSNNATTSTTHTWVNPGSFKVMMFMDVGADGSVDSTYTQTINVQPADGTGIPVMPTGAPGEVVLTSPNPLPVVVASPTLYPVAIVTPTPVPVVGGGEGGADDSVVLEDTYNTLQLGFGLVVFLGAVGLLWTWGSRKWRG